MGANLGPISAEWAFCTSSSALTDMLAASGESARTVLPYQLHSFNYVADSSALFCRGYSAALPLPQVCECALRLLRDQSDSRSTNCMRAARFLYLTLHKPTIIGCVQSIGSKSSMVDEKDKRTYALTGSS